MSYLMLGLGVVVTFVLIMILVILRVVVPTNAVHIVQYSRKTVSFGKGQTAGNTYYRWPEWVPLLGVTTVVLPVSVFSHSLKDYAAYDKGRVPFVIDIIAFFRITDSNMAAERVKSFDDLEAQLGYILQGAIRTILASSDIEAILQGRGEFGEMFTTEVDQELEQWGVKNVKCIELMDIRDGAGSHVIENIMAKKKSLIEMESRVEVAKNLQAAKMAEVDAQRAVEVQQQDAAEQVGIRTADQQRKVGIATQVATQEVREQERLTAIKTMAITEVNQVRSAEIQRAAQVVNADARRQTDIIQADAQKAISITLSEGEKQKMILTADGGLEAAKRQAEGTQVQGIARAEAEKALQLAPVAAQIALAEQIGGNTGYQTYLLSIREIEARQVVGIEQAKALQGADIKVITNSDTPATGIKNVMELFSSKGGTKLGAMVEGFKNSPAGAQILNALTE